MTRARGATMTEITQVTADREIVKRHDDESHEAQLVALREWQYEYIDERVHQFKAAKAAPR